MNPIAAFRAAVRFAKMRSSWLGAGGEPISLAQAQTRANTCLDIDGRGTSCPLNQHHPWWEFLAAPAIAEVNGQLQLKGELRLRVHNEEKLHTCEACWCLLGLKVFVPLPHIRQTTPLDDLHPSCWIHREITAADLNTPTP